MKLWQKIAMFMIYLVVSIPFVFAQELSIQKFQGKDNARGYARIQDQLTVEVLAKIPGEDIIDKEQVRLYYQGMYTTFDSCNATAGGYYTCKIFDPEFESYQPLEFDIELRDDADNTVGQEKQVLGIDNQAPVIKEMTVDPAISNSKVVISYSAEDYALSYGDVSACSGLKAIIIKSGTETLSTDSAGIGECTKDNQLEVSFDTAGTKQICITALDYVNYASTPKCKEVKIDKAPPTIKDLTILDQQGFRLTHVHAGEERIATINAVITDDGEVDPEGVKANFEQLNPGITDLLPPDVINSDIYSWQGIPVTEASPCKITITARDTLGNEQSKEFACNIKTDDTPPEVKGIIADTSRDGVPLFGYGTQLIIEFEEKDNTGGPGIGLANRNIYLDMNELGMSTQQPDVCSRESGAKWLCSWFMNPPLATPEGPYTVKVTTDSTDDLGNAVSTEASFDLIYDNTGPLQPQIIDVKTVTGEAGVTYEGGAVQGDYVQFKVRSKDFTTAFANFSDLGGNDKEPATVCEDSEGGQDCTFEDLVSLDGPYTAKIGFSFYDDANNKASTETTIEVYGIENATTANYWKKPSVTCSPRVVDRKTASIIPPMVTCRLDLYTPNRKVTTLAVSGPSSPDQCTGDVDLNVNDIYMINNAGGTTSPYLFIRLEPKDYKLNKLEINCPITIYSKREEKIGDKTRYFVSPTPQKVDANITLEFYNNLMGELDSGVENKIQRALDSGWANAKWLGDLRKYLYYGEMICWAKSMIVNILTTLYALVGLLAGVGAILTSAQYTKAAGEAVNQISAGLCTTEEDLAKIFTEEDETLGAIWAFFDTICAIINCKTTGTDAFGTGFADKWVSFCKNPLDLKGVGGDVGRWFGRVQETSGASFSSNIKESLILSTICLCLPGVIYNLEKLRQIDCFRAVCLYDYVKQQGYTVDFCDQMHGYLVCTFIIGEIFAIIPFTAFFNKLLDMVLTFIADPWAFITTTLGAVCETMCEKAEESTGDATTLELLGFMLCALLKTVAVLGDSMATIKKMTSTKNAFAPPGSQYCDRMEEIKDEIKEAKKTE